MLIFPLISLASSSGYGYRSLGYYDSGWFDGMCGTGNPFYLMCQACRDKYLQVKFVL